MRRWSWLLVLLACDPPAAMSDDDGGADSGVDAGPRPVTEQWLEDVTARSGVDFERPDSFETLPERHGGGVCVLDADGVPPFDLFFALQPWPGGGSLLYVADEPLAFEDATDRLGLSDVGGAMGCLAFDADGDGDDDLLVTGVGRLRLFLRRPEGFVERSDVLGIEDDEASIYTSAAAGDVDGDGDLDLLVGAGALNRLRDGVDCEDDCIGDIGLYPPSPNRLLLRDADGSYRDASAELAPELLVPEPTLMVAITDLNGDGSVDLYVGNDLGGSYHNRPLLRGEDGVYRDAHLAIGLGHNASGGGMDTMGFSTADLNSDGQLDHVVTSFERDPSAVFLCQRRFCEPMRPEQSGTTASSNRVRWGVALVDIDLDGQPDLFEAAGHPFQQWHLDLRGDGRQRDQLPSLMQNIGGGRFAPVSATPALSPGSTRGIAVIDLDEDGRPDVVLAPAVGRPRLLRNVVRPFGASLCIRLRGRPPNTGGVGARVTVRAEGRVVGVQDRRVGEGYLGNFEPRVCLGVIGEGPFTLEVQWPGGSITTLDDVTPGERIVEEPL